MVSPRGSRSLLRPPWSQDFRPRQPRSHRRGHARLGFGTYRSTAMSRAMHYAALSPRLPYIDTAAGYENEHVVAAAIAESGIPRGVLPDQQAVVHHHMTSL